MYLGPYQRPAQLHSTAFCHSSAVSPGQFNEEPVCSGRDWNNCCFTQCSNDCGSPGLEGSVCVFSCECPIL